MTSSPRPLLFFIASVALLAGPLAGAAHAQIGPTTAEPGSQKPEGSAQEAPKEPGKLPTTPVLPPPTSKKKKFELFQLGGYYRLRGYWFKNFDLGFKDTVSDPGGGGAPFPNALACHSTSTTSNLPCESTIKTTDMRLRLVPVINIDERTSVHAEIDVFDNLVLGSTPNSYIGNGLTPPGNLPIDAFSNSQVDPQQGRNTVYDQAIRAKRAWGEVETPIGLLKFGRMPDWWGLGILANSGYYDPIHGTYDLDNDFGDTVDRVYFSATIPGTSLRGAVAMDWISTVPTASQTDLFSNQFQGRPFDLDDNDDVNQWMFVLGHFDSPDKFAEMVKDGDLALNYGARVTYRTQDWAQTGGAASTTPPQPLPPQLGKQPSAANFVPRHATLYAPDVWGRLGYGPLSIEAEVASVLGSIDDLTDFGRTNSLDVRSLGAVGRFGYKLLGGDLKLGFEVGYASGDQWDNIPQGNTNVVYSRPFPGTGDNTMTTFRFNRAYNIDLILFRQLIGAVENATYLRPSGRYTFADHFTARAQAVLSFANKPVATPGNGSFYGAELDADFGYRRDGFFAGIAYGILFPGSALNHPADTANAGGPGFQYGADNVGNAATAQTIQTRLVLAF